MIRTIYDASVETDCSNNVKERWWKANGFDVVLCSPVRGVVSQHLATTCSGFLVKNSGRDITLVYRLTSDDLEISFMKPSRGSRSPMKYPARAFSRIFVRVFGGWSFNYYRKQLKRSSWPGIIYLILHTRNSAIIFTHM